MTRLIKINNLIVDKKTGKLKRIHKLAAGQKSNKFAKAAREEAKWRAKSDDK